MPVPRRSNLLVLFLLAITAASAWWALAPVRLDIQTSSTAPIPLPAVAPVFSSEQASLDTSGFRAPIWVAPPASANATADLVGPPPPPTPTPPPLPPPRHLQLLAIVREDGTLKAILYDRNEDRLLNVVPGEQLGAHTVASITETMLTLGGQPDDGTSPFEIRLDPDAELRGTP